MTKTNPLPCILCPELIAATIMYFPEGCTCCENKVQPRCLQHTHDAISNGENGWIMESFTSMFEAEKGVTYESKTT